MGVVLRSKADRIAVVTGAARGIGRAFAQRLAGEGATVIAVDLDQEDDVAGALLAAGASAAAFKQADVSDEARVEALAREIIAEYGRCDILVNNAGVVPHEPLADITLANWRRTMAINVESVLLTCRAFFPDMARKGYGRVVNMSTDQLGLTLGGFSTYMASKAAIIGLTRALANEFGAQGITVNCIAPGLTKVPRTEVYGPLFDELAQAQAIKRHELPEDLVGAMSFLTSDDAAFFTGQTMIVDGGLLNAI